MTGVVRSGRGFATPVNRACRASASDALPRRQTRLSGSPQLASGFATFVHELLPAFWRDLPEGIDQRVGDLLEEVIPTRLPGGHGVARRFCVVRVGNDLPPERAARLGNLPHRLGDIRRFTPHDGAERGGIRW